MVNLALGGKLIWKLYTVRKHLVSKMFWMKYLKGASFKNLKSINTPTGTTFWNLCKRGIDNIHHQLYRIPGSGKRIFLWDDNILGNPPLSSFTSLIEIKSWLTNKELLRLTDICFWDSEGNWVGWYFPRYWIIFSTNRNCWFHLYQNQQQFSALSKINGGGAALVIIQLLKATMLCKFLLYLAYPLCYGK